MTYEEFLLKFGSSMDLVNETRRFLLSVLGPKGDCEPPPKNRKVIAGDRVRESASGADLLVVDLV